MDYEECDEEHFEAFPRNSKAMNMLYCAMKEEFFKNISICSMAKEIWKKLEQMYKDENSSERQSLNQFESCLTALEELDVILTFVIQTLIHLKNCKKHLMNW